MIVSGGFEAERMWELKYNSCKAKIVYGGLIVGWIVTLQSSGVIFCSWDCINILNIFCFILLFKGYMLYRVFNTG